MSRRRRRHHQPAQAGTFHPRTCQCGGTGLIPCAGVEREDGRFYPKVSTRCPGIGPGPVASVRDMKRMGAGDRDE